ncbi:response regulator [Methylobacterium durans]|uniref:Response regulatory domain-containing protein n=1 Tax=Methylobacterium durans TaxID=2202825 RepID=A0A2U8W2Z6_9HYPH|nr:response regulator [Methylobacterium durans]AWN40449.1 hypothetical protein DK389_07775 [Methylobacterium durans]
MNAFNDLRALVVDDQSMMAELLKSILGKLGFVDVAVAESGAEALERLRSERFHLVLADLKMEPMSGLRLVQFIRADAALKDTCVLMATASRDIASAASAKHVGVDDYLLKPFTPATLRARLEKLMPLLRRADG